MTRSVHLLTLMTLPDFLVDMIGDRKVWLLLMQPMRVVTSAGMILQKRFSVRLWNSGHTEYAEDKVTVTPVTTEEYGVSKAARPFNSRLDKSKLADEWF